MAGAAPVSFQAESSICLRFQGHPRDRAALNTTHFPRGRHLLPHQGRGRSASQGEFSKRRQAWSVHKRISLRLVGKKKEKKQCISCSQLEPLERGSLRTGLWTVLAGGRPAEMAQTVFTGLLTATLHPDQLKLESRRPPPGPTSLTPTPGVGGCGAAPATEAAAFWQGQVIQGQGQETRFPHTSQMKCWRLRLLIGSLHSLLPSFPCYEKVMKFIPQSHSHHRTL